MSMYEDKHRLFADYRKELDKYSGNKSDPEEIRSTCDDYINSKDFTWKNIFDPETKELIGFLIIGKKSDNHYIPTERLIEEAYIEPNSRGNGYMRERLIDYESRHHYPWSYVVIKKNTNAIVYWSNLFKQMNYELKSIEDIYDGLELYYWEPIHP